MLNLTKGDKLDLIKNDGSQLSNFCVGLNWGAIVRTGMFGFGSNKEGVDLDASTALFASNNQVVDVIYFGKLISSDGAVKHSGDDLIGDTDGDDGLDNEIITVNLNLLNPGVDKIVFMLNSYKGQDFATIPFANIRLYEGTPDRVQSVFAKFDIAKDPKFAGNVSMVMGKLYKRNNQWKFETIGEPTRDTRLQDTISAVMQRFL
jgi:tellurium resistance protein TerZ